MRRKLRSRRPSHATVVAYLALFVALGGTAVATHETILSSDIQDGEVRTPDLANLGVTTPKLASNAVTSPKVLNNSLTGADLGPSALTRGRTISSEGYCDPTSTAWVDCGTLGVTLNRPSRVLITATGEWWSIGPDGVTNGHCQLAVNGFRVQPTRFLGEKQDVSDSNAAHSLALTNMTSPESLGPGQHDFGLHCREVNGDLVLAGINVSVVILGSA